MTAARDFIRALGEERLARRLPHAREMNERVFGAYRAHRALVDGRFPG